jgi:type VI secretion system protein ImpI
MDSLPDGGPLSIELDRRGIDIGRDSYLDWTLPDPSRFVSGKHCEVRYRDGGYWLHDVSTNGTTVNEASGRLTEPYLLKNGDRIHIGDYIIVADIDGGGGQSAQPVPQGQEPSGGDPWGGFDNIAESVSKRDFVAASAPPEASTSGRPVMGDVTEEEFSWSVGEVEAPSGADMDSGADVDADWATPPESPAARPPPAELAPAPADNEEEPLELQPASEPAPSPPPQRQGKLAEQWQGEDRAPAREAPPPSATPATPPAASPDLAASGGDWVSAFERGAGLPPGSVARAKGEEVLAEEMGHLVRLVAENLKAMLAARDETKNAMRSSQRTMIQAMENKAKWWSTMRCA